MLSTPLQKSVSTTGSIQIQQTVTFTVQGESREQPQFPVKIRSVCPTNEPHIIDVFGTTDGGEVSEEDHEIHVRIQYNIKSNLGTIREWK